MRKVQSPWLSWSQAITWECKRCQELSIPMLKLWEYNIAKKAEFPGIVDFHTPSCMLTEKLCTEIHLCSND